MKQVILIGDSIRSGYKNMVATELAGAAEVWSPEVNCGTTSHTIVGLCTWAFNRPSDVIHVNCGLHDIKTIWFGGRSNVVPLAHYRDNVETILRALSERTKAKVIWATMTPINETNAHTVHAHKNDFDRFEEDVITYNKAAVEVATRLGVLVDDLFDVVTKDGKDKLLTQDGVHFLPEGYELLGKAVAGVIRKQLG